MWPATTSAQHRRDGLRFASDLTDAEWAVIMPLLPQPSSAGRPAEWPMREIVNAIFYVLRGGIPWRTLPPCFPLWQTAYGWFAAWRGAGVGQTISHHLVMQNRGRVGREGSPSAAVVDSQSVKTTEAGHIKTDLDGRLPDFHLIGSELGDSTQFGTSLDIRPRIAMTDKG